MRADEKLTAFVELEWAVRVAKTNIRALSRGLWVFLSHLMQPMKRQHSGESKYNLSYLAIMDQCAKVKTKLERGTQHMIILAVVSMRVLYVLIIVGCLCYIGQRRTVLITPAPT